MITASSLSNWVSRTNRTYKYSSYVSVCLTPAVVTFSTSSSASADPQLEATDNKTL